MPSNTIEGPYLNDLLEQPAALERAWAHLKDSDLTHIADRCRIVLTGMGSSQYSLYPLHLHLIRHGLSSHLVETAELIHYQQNLIARDALVIAVSQSGQSAEIVALAEAVRGRVPLIAVTNTPDSPLAAAADILLEMHAGQEATVSCKTYVCSLLMLEWLAALLTGEDTGAVRDRLAHAAPAAERYLQHWRQHTDSLTADLAGVSRIFVTGRGPSLAAAETAGLILKESVRFAAEGLSCPAFRHGPFEVMRPDVLVVVMAGDDRSSVLNRRLADDVRAAGGRARLVCARDGEGAFRIPNTPERLRPVAEILPVQMLTLALGVIAGRQPGKFEFNTKVTTTE
jgi:glutamine---fructose-6-phosphate transaminase (isomerizing)